MGVLGTPPRRLSFWTPVQQKAGELLFYCKKNATEAFLHVMEMLELNL